MTDVATGLNEVVVIGYGTRTKGALTGSVANLNGDALMSRPIVNVLDGIQGLIPGVSVTQSSGAPGDEGYSFDIRGISSINGTQPLVLVDGIPTDNFSNINPQDIKDITVLKDASAAIYGARAADGVILVTTKKGSTGAPQIEYSTNISMKQPENFKNIVNTYQLYSMFNDAAVNSGNPAPFSQTDLANTLANNPVPGPVGRLWYLTGYPLFYQSFNQNKLVYKNSIDQNHNVTISGGTENMHYLLSGGYLYNNGNVRFGDNNFTRYNLRSNLQFNIGNKLKLDTRFSMSDGNRNEPTQLGNALEWLPRMWSFEPIYTSTGQFYQYQGYANIPQWLAQGGNATNKDIALQSNIKVDYTILDGLVLTGQLGVNYDSNVNDAIWQTFNTYNWDGSLNQVRFPNNARQTANDITNYSISSAYVNYTKTFYNVHNLNVMIGTSYEHNEYDNTNIWAQNFLTNSIFTYNLYDNTSVNNTSLGEDKEAWALFSLFGRVGYNYNNKYFIDATLRQDASSKFAPDKRTSALFPSVALAWKISDENFVKKLHIFNELKFRISYGRSGNQDIAALPTYGYIPLISINTNQYPMGLNDTPISTATVQNPVASPTRTWETIENKNIGLNMLVLNSRLSVDAEVFTKKNINMLLSPTLPATFGASAPTMNLGTLFTNGWELTVGWKDKIGDFQYGVKGDVWFNHNELTNLLGANVINPGWNYAVQGYAMGTYFGYVSNGMIQNAQQLSSYQKYAGKGIVPSEIGIGDIMYKDLDGDGTIQPYPNVATGVKGDMINLGSSNPKLNYSINLNLAYKNFDFTAVFFGQGNHTIIRNDNYSLPFGEPWWQPAAWFWNKTWSTSNTNAMYPKLTMDQTILNYDYQPSTLTANIISFIDLRTIELGYTIPKYVLKSLKINSLRVYISGQDLFNINKGTWGNTFNPQEGSGQSTYPFYKTYSVGLDVTL
jgi:TonB-linked SusC/RagA family outer membrane protein